MRKSPHPNIPPPRLSVLQHQSNKFPPPTSLLSAHLRSSLLPQPTSLLSAHLRSSLLPQPTSLLSAHLHSSLLPQPASLLSAHLRVIYPPMYRNAFSSSYVMGAMLFTGHLVFKGIDAFRSPSKTSIVKCW